MKIEKLDYTYRVRKTINKKQYTLYFDHSPTETEILMAISKQMKEVNKSEHIPFSVAANEYCKLKKNVISPTTYREYTNTCDRLSDTFTSLYIDQITQLDIQMEINTLAKDKAPKTVRNYHGFIVAVIKMYRPDFVFNTTLPQKKVKEVYIPVDDEIKMIFEHAKNHRSGMFYIPIMLACYGLRRGEICALTPADIDENNIVSITKEKVMDVNKEWIIKQVPKTENSYRKIPISSELAQMIRNQGYVYNGHPNSISSYLSKACKRLGIKHFSTHKLRHYFCSRLSAENIDIETIMALGGWKSDYVLKNIYRHSVTSKVQEASDKLTAILNITQK